METVTFWEQVRTVLLLIGLVVWVGGWCIYQLLPFFALLLALGAR